MQATIAAIATGPAAGGIGVIRISGPGALAAAQRVCRVPEALFPRTAVRVRLTVHGAPVDEGLLLFFPAPRSYTGEDVVELHAHGAPRLLQLVLEEVLGHEGARLAEPGEFTRRAFLAGKLDLTRAEAVADLIAAESEAQVRAAAAQLQGELAARVDEARALVLGVLADVEGVLEFPEEAEGAEEGIARGVERAGALVQALLDDGERGALVRRGARVVLYGPVNAGKSTLFNRLAGAERALVDAEPGTTRDALEARLELGGLGVTLVDTAGLRETPGRLEALGIARAREALSGADLGVLVVPPAASLDELARWRSEVPEDRRLEVAGKADLRGAEELAGAGLAVSGASGAGVEALRAAVARRLGAGLAGAAVGSSERHLECLREAAVASERARAAVAVSTLEVVGGELRLALEALARMTGEDVGPAVLDAIFTRFCIGK